MSRAVGILRVSCFGLLGLLSIAAPGCAIESDGGPERPGGGESPALPDMESPGSGVVKGPEVSASPGDAAFYNHAGCDSPMDGASCGPQGQCCDTHDACIAANCAPGCGTATACLPILGVAACQAGGANYNAACCACHTAVMGCFNNCSNNPNAPGCGPADCCEAGNCGCEQQCYDAANNQPIYDPCACQALGLAHPAECHEACGENNIQGCGREYETCTDDCPCGDGMCCDNYTCLPCGGTGGGGGSGTGGFGGTGGTGGFGGTGGTGGTGGFGSTGGTGGYGGTGGSGGYGGTGGTGGYVGPGTAGYAGSGGTGGY
ncbi:MAG: hypothetical protein R3B70_07970 [Polyangiaceae bacterium]